MNLAGFKDLFALTYTDRLSVKRHVEIINSDGTTGLSLPNTPIYDDVQCRISFNQTDNPEPGKEDSNPIYMQIKLFCAPELDIRKGDSLVAQRLNDDGSVLKTYTGKSNLPLQYASHLEVMMTEVGDA